jgi:hypothetical protein
MVRLFFTVIIALIVVITLMLHKLGADMRAWYFIAVPVVAARLIRVILLTRE